MNARRLKTHIDTSLNNDDDPNNEPPLEMTDTSEVRSVPITMVSVRKLKPNPGNVHTHPKKQIRQLADSILRFGFISPLLVDENYNVLAGHGRLERRTPLKHFEARL